MNKLIAIVLVFIFLNISVNAQRVSRQFEVTYEGTSLLATFDFSTLPKPLEPVTVNFTLEIVDSVRGVFSSMEDWDFTINTQKYIEILGSNTFTWFGSHEIGDTYSGSFQILPRTSGNNAIVIRYAIFDKYYPKLELSIALCFDTNGKLLFLGNSGTNSTDCNPRRTTFFDQDSIHILERYQTDYGRMTLFNYSINVQPPFKIGDTSTVQYRLVSYGNYDKGIDLVFESYAMDIVLLPKKIDYSITKNQTLEFEVKVVPLAVRTSPRLWLFMNRSQDVFPFTGERNQQILISTIFNEDGTLSAVSDHSFERMNDLLPESFTEYDIKIHRSYMKISNDVEKD